MRWVRPKVFLLAKTGIKDTEVKEWLKHIGVDDETAKRLGNHYRDPDLDMPVPLEQAVRLPRPVAPKTHGERLIELPGRRCYMSFVPGLNPNVTKIREDIVEYLTNIMKVGHGSVLEHYYFSLGIEGGSRVFTGEMNRHRAGMAISEGSMRFILFTDIPFVETPILQMTEEDDAIVTKHFNGREDFTNALAVKKHLTRESIKRVLAVVEKEYAFQQDVWKEELAPESTFRGKKDVTSMMRRIVPMGVGTGGVWTGNVRALRHLLTMRLDEPAEEEIALIGALILEIMMKEEPILFGDFAKNERGYWRPKYVKV